MAKRELTDFMIDMVFLFVDVLLITVFFVFSLRHYSTLLPRNEVTNLRSLFIFFVVAGFSLRGILGNCILRRK